MFALLYFSQGAAMAYFQNFQKPYLRGLGISLDRIALLTTLLLMPFILKMFFALVSDRFSFFGKGHRKPYMLLGLAIALGAFGMCALNLPSSNFFIFSICVVAASFGVALYDSTTDGYAVETTSEKDQGRVQGAMVGGRAFGVISMSLLFGFIAESFGYRMVFSLIALGMLLPVYFVLQLDESYRKPITEKLKLSDFSDLISKKYLLFIVYGVAYSFISFGHDGIITLHLKQSFAISDTSLGHYGALRGLGAVLGAGLGAWLLSKVNRYKVAYASLLLLAFGAYSSGNLLDGSNYKYLGVLWGLIWGLQETVYVTLAMSRSSPKLAAASFALLMAFSNVGTSLGEGWATAQLAYNSFGQVFNTLAGFGLLVPLALYFVQKSESRARTAWTH